MSGHDWVVYGRVIVGKKSCTSRIKRLVELDRGI